MIRLLISGSKSFVNKEKIYQILNMFREIDNIHIITGGSKGTEEIAEEFADEYQLELTSIKPDWEENGNFAGYIRNEDLINLEPDFLVTFWDGDSPGTKDLIKKAKDMKIKTLIIYKE